MNATLFSPSWYRVAGLRPRLRPHTRLHRHSYRGAVWFLIQDQATGRAHRFTPVAHHLIGMMDGRRTVQQIWDAAVEHLGDDAPTQDEVIQLLAKLDSFDVLRCDVSPDSQALFKRYQRHEGLKWKRRLWSPLSIRIPLFDPDRFLDFWLPLIRPLYSGIGALIWLGVVLWASFLAGSHWTDLTADVSDRVLAPHNLFLLWLIYPAVKAVHEFGHGFAVKRWGGEVHEMGIMFLVFMPVPYVDASAATAFPDKRKRMLVAAAGIVVELFLASVALILWVDMGSGVARTLAYNVMLIGGVSTLLFNGNPLLRFDGYYILADALEIPNLGTRANRYLGYLFKRYLLGVKELDCPAMAPGERGWFVAYGIAAFVYRMFIMAVIVLFVAQKFFGLGVVLALWALTTGLLVPAGKSVHDLFTDPHVLPHRMRAVAISVGITLLLLLPVLWLPVPLTARAQGVVWVPEQSQVRAATEGFVQGLLVADRSEVHAGEAVVSLDDPLLRARVQVLEARIRELEARITAQQVEDRVRAAISREELKAVRLDLDRARQRLAALTVHSPADGVLVVPGAHDLAGRYLRKGALIGYVIDAGTATVRVSVTQDEVGLVRSRLQAVEALIADWEIHPLPARVVRFVPAGRFELPSPALGSAGGGRIPADPTDPKGRKALERIFELDLRLGESVPLRPGQRVHVRFDLGLEPLAAQWYRSLRQLFLRRFNV